MAETPKGPLARFRVLDLTRVRSGPTCVRQFADWGADVIKVESLDGDSIGADWYSPDTQHLHRNKRSLTLNLKSADGVAILKHMVKDADVLVENYRPDVKFRLGIDYETLRKINPELVYASISGFGQSGPYRDRPGFDQVAQGMGGLMSITGVPGTGPMRVGIALADLSSGIFAALGVLIALLEREESGEGQWVQSSLLAAQISMLDFQSARWTIGHEVPGQAGNNHPTAIPTGVFATTDGHITIAGAGVEIYRRCCVALSAPHLETDTRFIDSDARSRNRDALNAEIEAITRTQTTAYWIERLNSQGVPAGPIYSINEVFADPQVKHLNLTRKVHQEKLGELEMVGQPIELSRTPWTLLRPAPAPGEHTEQVLREFGYGEPEIADLRARRVV
jgi:crotonobetainyl-CoA:carnitine CoA-transferase CaiB-like acyl-CoA transferase